MQISVARQSLSRLCRNKRVLWAAGAVAAVLLMTLLAFGIAFRGNAETTADNPVPASADSHAEQHQSGDGQEDSWEGALKHKHTEPVSVNPKCKNPAQNGNIDRAAWYVTTDEYTDHAGNLRTIFNFCAYDWAGVRQWLVENEKPDWPYGGVKDAYLAKNWGKPVAMAIAACTLRECAGLPDQLQYMQRAGTLHGAFGTEVSNHYVFTCLENRAYDQGYGLIGWTFDALDDFIAFCKASGLNPRSLETQLYFMAYQYYASDSWHQRYSYLFAYENLEPTLENVQKIAQIHTSCVGMGSLPTTVYPSPTNDVYRILANWGNKTYPDFVSAASGAYAFLYQTAYNQQPSGDELVGIAASSMFTGEDGVDAVPGSMLDTTPAVSPEITTPVVTPSAPIVIKPVTPAESGTEPQEEQSPAESGEQQSGETGEPAENTEPPKEGGEEAPTQDEGIYTVEGPNILQ